MRKSKPKLKSVIINDIDESYVSTNSMRLLISDKLSGILSSIYQNSGSLISLNIMSLSNYGSFYNNVDQILSNLYRNYTNNFIGNRNIRDIYAISKIKLEIGKLKQITKHGFSPVKFRIIDFINYNFLDISECGKYITYIPHDTKNSERWRSGDYPFFKNYKRNKIKIGRFVNILLNGEVSYRPHSFYPNKPTYNYPSITINDSVDEIIQKTGRRVINNFDNSAVENFVNLFKSYYDIKYNSSNFKFKIVKGEDIKNGYKTSNYLRYYNNGSLSNSCMNDKLEYVDFYCRNKNISLLLLSDNNNNIIGRSLLWDCEDGSKVMDRVYYIRDHDEIIFKKWAKDNGYISIYRSNKLNGLSVKLDNIKYKYYPYLDTFFYFNRFTKKLYTNNPSNGILKIKYLYNILAYRKLRSTQGSTELITTI